MRSEVDREVARERVGHLTRMHHAWSIETRDEHHRPRLLRLLKERDREDDRGKRRHDEGRDPRIAEGAAQSFDSEFHGTSTRGFTERSSHTTSAPGAG